MEVWEQDSFARIGVDSTRLAQPNLGHIVENRVIQLALLEQVKKQRQCEPVHACNVQNNGGGESEAWLTLDNGQALTAKLVVGADGANSWVRKQQDIPLTHWDYGHSTRIVANVKTAEPHHSVARQIFTPQGPLAFLPMQTEQLELDLLVHEPNQSREPCINVGCWIQQVRRICWVRCKVGLCEVVGERFAFPLRGMRYARDCSRTRSFGGWCSAYHSPACRAGR